MTLTLALRTRVKSVIELVLTQGWATKLSRTRRRGQALILAYHNIITHHAAGGGDRSLHLPLDDFRRHLDILSQGSTVVPLMDILDLPDLNEPGPRVALTFDDAYRGAVTLGLRETVARQLPATVFVAPGLLGSAATWWDRLSGGQPGGMPGWMREECLSRFGGETEGILRAAPTLGWSLTEPHPSWAIATDDELRQCAAHPHVTVGSHSWSHSVLTGLSDARLREELLRPLAWLRSSNFNAVPVIAYPYGRFDSRVQAAVHSAGYSAALKVDGGWWRGTEDRMAVPRYNVPAGLRDDGLRARLSGLLVF